jgi:hypothetical protein
VAFAPHSAFLLCLSNHYALAGRRKVQHRER